MTDLLAEEHTRTKETTVTRSEFDQKNNNNEPVTLEKKRSYRILGTWESTINDAVSNQEEEEDPMAWADLEEFGGTKKRDEPKKKPMRQLTSQEVKEQLKELEEIDHKMQEAAKEKRSKQGIFHTIAWFKEAQKAQEEEQQAAALKRKSSSSLLQTIKNFFGSKKEDNQEEEEEAIIDSSFTFTPLQRPWGQEALNCHWTQIGFRLLNQSIMEDIKLLRTFIVANELEDASPQAFVGLAKWLRAFDVHVNYVIQLKEYLLEERTLVAGVGYKVTTVYDIYQENLSKALRKIHSDDRQELKDSILVMFTDLEAVLKDEELAVEDVLSKTLSEDKEYEAISSLFYHVTKEEETKEEETKEEEKECCGIILAKLVIWMKKNLSQKETSAFLNLFDKETKKKLFHEWIQAYSSYLKLLDHFSSEYDAALTYYKEY